MKEIILKSLFGYILAFVLFFLLSAFLKGNFDIKSWGSNYIIFNSLIAFVFGTILQLIIHRGK